MDVNNYIKELLFSKQPVYLPGIGVFEIENIPAQIDEKLGTITPPSKKVVFRDSENGDYAILANYISRNEKITLKEASSEIEKFAANILSLLQRGEEYEFESIGTLRKIGGRKIIFLPISSYSNTNASFGLPTLSIDGSESDIAPDVPIKPLESATAVEPEKAQVEASGETSLNKAENSSEEGLEKEKTTVPVEQTKEQSSETDDDDIFEFIDDPVEPVVDIASAETEPVNSVVTEEKLEGQTAVEEVQKEEPIAEDKTKEAIAEPLKELTETKDEAAIKAEPVEEELVKEPEERIAVPETSTPAYTYKSISEEHKDSNAAADIKAEGKRCKHGWIWTLVIVISLFAIALVALYHYKPEYFEFILPSKEQKAVKPAVPSDVDSSYFKAVTGSDKDTVGKADSVAAKDTVAVKNTVSASANEQVGSPAKSKMSSSEVEDIINEKLKQGLSEGKKADTQKFQATTPSKSSVVSSEDVPVPAKSASASVTAGQYSVIVASVASQKEAQKVIASLKDKGYSASVLAGSGKIRISIGSYPNAKQASNAANKAKANLGVDAWVLTPGK